MFILSGFYIGRPTLAPVSYRLCVVYHVLNVRACLFKHALIICHIKKLVKYFCRHFLKIRHSTSIKSAIYTRRKSAPHPGYRIYTATCKRIEKLRHAPYLSLFTRHAYTPIHATTASMTESPPPLLI